MPLACEHGQTCRAGLETAQKQQNRRSADFAGNQPSTRRLYFAFTAAKALAENTCGGRVNDACSQVPENLLVDCEVQSPVQRTSILFRVRGFLAIAENTDLNEFVSCRRSRRQLNGPSPSRKYLYEFRAAGFWRVKHSDLLCNGLFSARRQPACSLASCASLSKLGHVWVAGAAAVESLLT